MCVDLVDGSSLGNVMVMLKLRDTRLGLSELLWSINKLSLREWGKLITRSSLLSLLLLFSKENI